MQKSLSVDVSDVDPQRGGMSLADFEWRNRVLIIFPDDGHVDASRQAGMLLADADGLRKRDIIVLEVGPNTVKVLFGLEYDLDPCAIRYDLDVADGFFALVLVGMDGSIKIRSEDVVSLSAIFELIDQGPTRKKPRSN